MRRVCKGGREEREPVVARLAPTRAQRRADSVPSLLIWILTVSDTLSQGKPQPRARVSWEGARGHPENTKGVFGETAQLASSDCAGEQRT